nr:MAG TPA: hypothetical protein [Caudoviricetes sp.]
MYLLAAILTLPFASLRPCGYNNAPTPEWFINYDTE